MAKTGKSNSLLNSLKTAIVTPTAPPPELQPTPVKTSDGKAIKLSVSLYPADLQRLDAIKAHMQKLGFRNLSDSEALRLACRAVELDQSFEETYRQMQSEDKRRK